jgi:hypothetical protein
MAVLGLIKEKLYNIYNIPFVKNTLRVGVTGAASIAIADSVLIIMNPSAPLTSKLWSAAQATTCASSVALGYASLVIPEPRLSASLKVGSTIAGGLYMLTGGEVSIGLAINVIGQKKSP